ncbi:MAG: MBL fold metallo-hydrolase [Proteobacteria bacterium]|nr:MBL fold metallo-hydrolase [Pseudomonadota bacterium]
MTSGNTTSNTTGNAAGTELEQAQFGAVTVLFGARGGKYPHGNSLVVTGREEALVVDPSLGLLPPRPLPRVDRVVNSHCHEDHVAGNHLFADLPWHLHAEDLPGIRDLESMLAIYGFQGEIEAGFRRVLVEEFHFTPCPDPVPFHDGDVFELGGVSVQVIHTPGHTRGHSCLWIDGPAMDGPLLYLGDIDLSSFGPYYGDAWSDLEDFERSLERIRELDAAHYATFHHVGVLSGRAAFRERLDRFAQVIQRRETRLLEYLSEPRSLDEIAAHRFVYRPGDAVLFAEPVERRSMGQHLARLERQGRVQAVEGGRFLRVGAA